jgi:hypothetical protein
MIAEADSGR